MSAPAFLVLTLVGEDGSSESWQRAYIGPLPGVAGDPGSVFWGNVALLAGVAARELGEKGAVGRVCSGGNRVPEPTAAGIDAA